MTSLRRILSVILLLCMLLTSFLSNPTVSAASTSVTITNVKTLCNLVYSASYSPDGNSNKYDCYIIKDKLKSDFKLNLNAADKVIFFKNSQLIVDPVLNSKLMTMRIADKYTIWYSSTIESVNLQETIKKSAQFNKVIGTIGGLGSTSLGIITTTVLTGGSSEFAKLAVTSSAKVLKSYVLDVDNILTEFKWNMFKLKVDTMKKNYQEIQSLHAKGIKNYTSAKALVDKLTLLETDAHATTRILTGALKNIPNDVKEYFTKSVLGGFMEGATGSLSNILKTSDNILELMSNSDDFYKLCKFASDLFKLKDNVDKIDSFLSAANTFGEFSDYMEARNFKKTTNVFIVGREGNKAIVIVLTARLAKLTVLSIPNKYDHISNFSEGMAIVYKGNKSGYINTSGKEIVPVVYDLAGSFSSGLACVYKGQNFGFIDKTGKLVIPMKFSNEDPFWGREPFQFKNERCIVSQSSKDKENLYGVIDKTGKMIVPCKYTKLYLTNKGDVYYTKDYNTYINVNSAKETRTFAALSEADNVITGPYWNVDNKNNWSLYDKENICIAKNKYVYDILTYSEFSVDANYFKYSSGVAIAAKGAYATYRGDVKNKYWIVDEKGKEIKALDYDDAITFSEGLSLVKKNNKYGYIDVKGTLVIPLNYDYAMSFRDGYAIARTGNNNFVILRNPLK